MQAMNVRRPFGRVAVIWAGLLSLMCGWVSFAAAPEKEVPAPEPATSDSILVLNWQVAETLIGLGALEIDHYAEDGSAVGALAAASSGPSVLVVIDAGDVIATPLPGTAPPAPCPAGWVTGPGGRCISNGWQLFDYPPRWKVTACVVRWDGLIDCTYEYEFEFIRLSTGCTPACPENQVCVEFAEYTVTCVQTRKPTTDDGTCTCPTTPLGPGVGGCATPVLPNRQHPGVWPGAPLAPFVVTTGKKCYTPGAPW